MVMARELLDYRRQRRVWRRLFLQPLVVIAILATPVFFFQQAQAHERNRGVDVAVQGDLSRIPGLAAALARPPLKLHRTGDAARSVVASSADVGLIVSADAAAAVARGQSARVDVLTLPTNTSSRLGTAALAQRLGEYRAASAAAALTARGLPTSLATPIAVVPRDLSTGTASGTRFGLAQGLPALLVIQLFSLMGTAQERVAGAKDRRVLEPLLVLPFRRRDVIIGIGTASLLLGFAAASLTFVPVTAGLAIFVHSTSATLAAPAQVAGAIMLGALLLGTFFTAVGLYAGARAHSGSEGSTFVTVAQITVFAIVASTPFLSDLGATGPILAIPVIGPMLLVRQGAESGLTAVQVLIAVAGVALATRLLLDRATKLIDSESAVLRASQ